MSWQRNGSCFKSCRSGTIGVSHQDDVRHPTRFKFPFHRVFQVNLELISQLYALTSTPLQEVALVRIRGLGCLHAPAAVVCRDRPGFWSCGRVESSVTLPLSILWEQYMCTLFTSISSVVRTVHPVHVHPVTLSKHCYSHSFLFL
jgi:hypothetical protein